MLNLEKIAPKKQKMQSPRISGKMVIPTGIRSPVVPVDCKPTSIPNARRPVRFVPCILLCYILLIFVRFLYADGPEITAVFPVGIATNVPDSVSIWATYSDTTSEVNPDECRFILDGYDMTAESHFSSQDFAYNGVLEPGSHIATLNLVDLANDRVQVIWAFFMEDTPPALSNISPVDRAENLPLSTTVSGTYSDVSGIDLSGVRFYFDRQDKTNSCVWNPDSFKFSNTGGMMTKGNHTARVVVPDTLGNTTDYSWTFSVETNPAASSDVNRRANNLLTTGTPDFNSPGRKGYFENKSLEDVERIKEGYEKSVPRGQPEKTFHNRSFTTPGFGKLQVSDFKPALIIVGIIVLFLLIPAVVRSNRGRSGKTAQEPPAEQVPHPTVQSDRGLLSPSKLHTFWTEMLNMNKNPLFAKKALVSSARLKDTALLVYLDWQNIDYALDDVVAVSRQVLAAMSEFLARHGIDPVRLGLDLDVWSQVKMKNPVDGTEYYFLIGSTRSSASTGAIRFNKMGYNYIPGK